MAKRNDRDTVVSGIQEIVDPVTGEVMSFTSIQNLKDCKPMIVRQREDFSRDYVSLFIDELASFISTRPSQSEMLLFMKLLTMMKYANEIVTTKVALADTLGLSRQAVTKAFQSLEQKRVIVSRKQMHNSTMKEFISIPLAEVDRLNFNLAWNGTPGVNNRLVKANVHPHIGTQINDIDVNVEKVEINNRQQISVTNIGKVDKMQVNVVVKNPEDARLVDLEGVKKSLRTENVNIILDRDVQDGSEAD